MLDRRQILSGSLGLGAGFAAAAADSQPASARQITGDVIAPPDPDDTIHWNPNDNTNDLQAAIDAAAAEQRVFRLPAGNYVTGPLILPANCQISGVPGRTFLSFKGGACIKARNVNNIRLQGLVFDGQGLPLSEDPDCRALVSLMNVDQAIIRDCRFQKSVLDGVALAGTSGQIIDNEIMLCGRTGLFALDSTGMDISRNLVHDCGNNGIQIWRSQKGEDGTTVSLNRIERIRADMGGSGQYGNGINIFRAGQVSISNNVINDCAFSAIRANTSSNVQMTGNNCSRIGEVALYAEFDFEGALISGNVIDDAASGIAVTNFKQGGRLAVVQGNLIRNLFTRDHYDARGVGISAEADTLISGNTVENAPVAGIMLGWGKHLRDVAATNNLIRETGIGVGISVSDGAGKAAVINNMISGTKNGAIRTMNFLHPVGEDLVATEKYITGNLSVSGNIAG